MICILINTDTSFMIPIWSDSFHTVFIALTEDSSELFTELEMPSGGDWQESFWELHFSHHYSMVYVLELE